MTRPGAAELPMSETPLLGVLFSLASEFAELSQLADEMQAVLSPALMRLADDPDCLRNVQMLDLFSQRLDALAMFVNVLTKNVPANWIVDTQDAVGVIKLSALADRLVGAAEMEPSADAGTVDFF
jgi:hypothetical protein